MRLDFFLPGEPPTITAQEKGLSTMRRGYRVVPIAYETPEVKNVRRLFQWQLSGHRPAKEMKGPIRLVTVWTWKATKAHKAGTYRDTKPDSDNIIKLFKDAMADIGYFENDSRVADERTIKRWGTVPGIRVIVEEIGRSWGADPEGDHADEIEELQEATGPV